VLHGEAETGATLHYMAEKPDAGDIVAQTAVTILPDETAREVFDKVTAAAAATLDRVLPALLAGSAPRTPQDLSQGSYFGGRRPEDGRIDWSLTSRQIHNLVRAVAPPFPGAFTSLGDRTLRILRTHVVDELTSLRIPRLWIDNGHLFADCGGGGRLEIVTAELEGRPFDASSFATLPDTSLPLEHARRGA
jgi:methionyl-tRNA formyltransferase